MVWVLLVHPLGRFRRDDVSLHHVQLARLLREAVSLLGVKNRGKNLKQIFQHAASRPTLSLKSCVGNANIDVRRAKEMKDFV